MEELSTFIPYNILGKKNTEYSLPLVYHLLDVACVGEYLWDKWLCEEVKSLIEISIPNARSLFLLSCYIHDLGKSSDFFQGQLDGSKTSDWKDHIHLTNRIIAQYLFSDFNSNYYKIEDSFLLELVSYHHGIQLGTIIDATIDKKHFLCFEEVSQYIDCVLNKLGLTKDCFYLTFYDIPFSIRDVLSGMLIMADWIGSNSNIFYLYKDAVPIYEKRKSKAIKEISNLLCMNEYKQFQTQSDFFSSVFGFTPNVLQESVLSVNTESKKLIFIEAPTGHGKTEAALSLVYKYLNSQSCLGRGFYIAMPTRATSNALYYRILSFLQSVCIKPDSCKLHHSKSNIFFYNKNEAVNVDVENNEVINVNFDKYSDLKDSIFKYKLTIARPYIIGTVDHILKICMNVKHFTMLHTCIVNHVIVFDEVHSYDARMFSCLCASLSFLAKYNVPVIILSATMPEDKRNKLMNAYGKEKSLCINAYPTTDMIQDDSAVIRVSGKEEHKYVSFDLTLQPEYHLPDEYDIDAKAVIDKIIQLGCVGYYGIIVNTVRRSQGLYEIIKREFGEENVILLHSQMTAEHRNKIEKTVLSILGKSGLNNSVPEDRQKHNYFKIIISTQIVEQSIDIDFDCIFTDLCPMDALIQRVGRLHRHAQNNKYRPCALSKAQCFVLQAYYSLNILSNDVASYCSEKMVSKEDIKQYIDKYSKLVYDAYLLYSTYAELNNLKGGLMDTITQTEYLVKCVYGYEKEKTLFGVSLKEFYNSYKNKEHTIEDGTYSDMFPVSQSGTVIKKASSHDINDFMCYLEDSYLYENGLNEKTDADVRDTRASMEVIALNKYSDDSGVFYTSCLTNKKVDIQDRTSLEFHSINLPTKVVHKCGGINKLKDLP